MVQRGLPTEVRNHPHTSKLYLAVKQPRVIWRGRVAAERGHLYWPPDEDQYITLSEGDSVDPYEIENFLPDLTVWVGTDIDLRDRGVCRAKRFEGDNLQVAADMTCFWRAGDYVSITDLHELWPREHIVEEDGGEITVYKDHDLEAATWKDEHPIPIMGAPVCAFLSGDPASVTVYFNGAASYRVQPNSDEVYAGWATANGIASYAWWLEGGTPATSTDANPTVTYDTAGQYVARLEVTDEDGNTERGFRNVYIFDDAHPPFTEFSVERWSGSLSDHGWEAELQVFGDGFDRDELPAEAEAVLFAEEWFDGVDRSYAPGHLGQHHRENVKMVGWIVETALQYGDGKVRQARITLRGLQHFIQNKSNFPAYFTMIETEAPAWSYFNGGAGDPLTVRKTWYHLLRWHWTIIGMADVLIPDDHNNYLHGQNFPEGTLAAQLDSFCKDTQSRWAVDRGAALHIFSWPNWLPVSGDGAGWRERCKQDVSITDADCTGHQIEPRVRGEVARVRVEGVVAYADAGYDLVQDLAPGDIRGHKGATVVLANQVLGTGGFEGSQGWELARMLYAEESRRLEKLTLPMLGNYSMFDIVPPASFFKHTLSPASTLRGQSWTDRGFWVTSISHEVDHENGDISTSITAQPETEADPDTPIFSDPEGTGDAPQEKSAGGGYTLSSYLQSVDRADVMLVPALMGDGGSLVAGAQEGTTWVRLLGDMKLTVLAENREFKNIADRPVLVEVLPADRDGGRAGQMRYRIAKVANPSDANADSDAQRAYVQHKVVFSVPTVVVASPAAPPFEITRHPVTAKMAHARVATAPVGASIVCQITVNGGLFSEVSIGAGAYYGSVSAPGDLAVGDYVGLNITQVGSTTAGAWLTVQLEVWEWGM